MSLKIETFSNATGGGNSFFKAIGHPAVAGKGQALVERLNSGGPVAVYDPYDMLAAFTQFFDLSAVNIVDVFVQDVEKLGRSVLGQPAQPVSALSGTNARTVFVAAFDTNRLVQNIAHLLPAGATLVTFDALRLPDGMVTDKRTYLSPINFATNFAFFRDSGGQHTKLVTANYWGTYGAASPALWLCLFDEQGKRLAEWTEPLPGPNATVTLDSAEIRTRFGLPEFDGQLFLHVVGAAGHDVVKYALDTYDDAGLSLSCTHDANAWPADQYAGLPAPREGEQVLLWVQNSHPCPIPAGAVGLNLMGHDEICWLDQEIAPFGSHALDVAALLPAARWPQQIEIQAGKHFVRPRYEVVETVNNRRRIAHPNVERVDLKHDPRLAELGNLLGKGFILPAPVLPVDKYRSLLLPTPMSSAQGNLPLALIVYDADGTEVWRQSLGLIKRSDSNALEISSVLNEVGRSLPSGQGHMELIYDFSHSGGIADGWLHGLFRYEHRRSGHAAETSFGAHMFNTVLTYKNEPQSYGGRAPGLSTRLFLRVGGGGRDTLCHLIYAASTPWAAQSDTHLLLTNRNGQTVAERRLQISCSGSHLFTVNTTFTEAERAEAGDGCYVLIRDTTCRLFGYHGLMQGEDCFSLDHMFGF